MIGATLSFSSADVVILWDIDKLSRYLFVYAHGSRFVMICCHYNATNHDKTRTVRIHIEIESNPTISSFEVCKKQILSSIPMIL